MNQLFYHVYSVLWKISNNWFIFNINVARKSKASYTDQIPHWSWAHWEKWQCTRAHFPRESTLQVMWTPANSLTALIPRRRLNPYNHSTHSQGLYIKINHCQCPVQLCCIHNTLNSFHWLSATSLPLSSKAAYRFAY